MQPLISIVIANYNYGRFLEDAIRSVLTQGVGGQAELIICDAASSDNSVEIIEKYADGLPPNVYRGNRDDTTCITWWCSERDGGQSAAFNKGFSHANGKYLTWLNADDVFYPGALQAVIREMKRHPECEWFTGSSIWCDAHLFLNKVFRAHRFSSMRVAARSLTCGGPSSFFAKRLYEAAGKIDESLHYVMDNDLWYRFVLKHGAKYRRVTDWVWVFRCHEESKMSGRTIDPDSERSKANDARIKDEGRRQREKWGTPSWLLRQTNRIPVSFVDSAIARLKQLRWSGRSLDFISGQRVVRPVVLMSNSIQEYIGGLKEMDARIFAFNNLWRKKFADEQNVTYLDESYFNSVEKCAAIVEKEGVNVLYAQGARSLLFFSKVRRACKTIRPKLLGNCHTSNLWDNRIRSLVLVLLAAFVSDGFVFISGRTQKKWAWLCRLLGLRHWHVPNHVDVSRFQPKELAAVPKRIVIGFLGSIRKSKNQELIIDIVNALRKHGVDACGRIGGNIPADGAAYRRYLEQKAQENGIADFIKFDGIISYEDVPTWMRQIDIYVCPSRQEVMPFNILEAMATGIPVVAHDVGAINEEVRMGENGALISSLEVDEYVNAILRLLEGGVKAAGAAGRRIVEEEYSFSRYAQRMASVLY